MAHSGLYKCIQGPSNAFRALLMHLGPFLCTRVGVIARAAGSGWRQKAGFRWQRVGGRKAGRRQWAEDRRKVA